MHSNNDDQHQHAETTCGSLLHELQKIWDEVGEPDSERDKMLFELEQECLEAYRRKVDRAKKYRAQLRQAIADSEAELADICSAMGEPPVHTRQTDQKIGNLKEEFDTIIPQLEEMRKRKRERMDEFVEFLDQIWSISNEIFRSTEDILYLKVVDESDISLKRLEELHRQLFSLQKEKSDRLKQVEDLLITLNSLCVVLGMDFNQTIIRIHPTLSDSEGVKSVSDDTLEGLDNKILTLQEVKRQRMRRLQDLATTMLELWNLMDTPFKEQQRFQNVTSKIAASEDEITEPNTLSVDSINYLEAEVLRLEQLKSSKMKELALKKRSDLEELCRRMHLLAEAHGAKEYSVEAIESGDFDPAYLLEQFELQITKIKEEAFSRKEILEKVEKWLAACEEECWLEEYNRDDNRYSAGRGAHLTLKRAEKARALVNKVPAMVEALTSKATAWEKEKGIEFSYDGVRLLSMLEQYVTLRLEKEQASRRLRDQKRLQGQMITEQEALFGSKPSPSKSGKKAPRTSTGGAGNGRFSLSKPILQNQKPEKAGLFSCPLKNGNCLSQLNSQKALQDRGSAAQSSGRRNLEITSHTRRKHSSKAANICVIESSSSTRMPFSPVTSSVLSKANISNSSEDQSRAQHEIFPRTIPSGKPPTTPPSKPISFGEENQTPKTLPIPVPPTPPTVSIPMQTATTPATPCSLYDANKAVIAEIYEYSFEERRAGFIMSKAHPNNLG